LRISGIITETDNELVSKGIHHALTLEAGSAIVIDKGRRWQHIETKILTTSYANTGHFILVAIDSQEACVARISGTHVKVIPNIYSGQSGKRYQTKSNFNIEIYFTDIIKMIFSIITENDSIIVFGPGETKRRFFNILLNKQEISKDKVRVIEGVDVAGEDGIYVFLRSSAMKEVMSASKLAIVSSILDKIMLMVNRGEGRFAMGINEVSKAATLKAIDEVVFSDAVFKTANDDDIIKLLNSIESFGARTFAVDSSTDIGLRVSSLGGIIALLRFPIR
jgi:protein pelota